MSNFYKRYPKLIAFFTYYQMLGGLIGLLVTFILLRNPSSDGTYILRMTVQTLFFAFSFYCGYLFLNKDLRRATDLSIVCHILQLLQIQIGGLFYVFASGTGLFIKILGTQPEMGKFWSISYFNLEIISLNAPAFLSLNLVAFVMIILLILLKQSYEK